MTTSPAVPEGKRFPSISMIAIFTPVPGPTDPGFLAAGGRGFEAIWCEASVIPYASRTGAPKADSRLCIISGDSAALHERMKRKFSAPCGRSDVALASSSEWIVGTAEYQVERVSRTVRQKERGLNFGRSEE